MSDAFLAADAVLSPWFIVVAGIVAVLSCWHLWRRTRERGAVILAWGGFNFAAAYSWIYATQPPFVERAFVVRLSIIWLLVSIIYYTGRRAHLYNDLLTYIKSIRGRG